MKRKLLTLALALIMCLSSFSAMAKEDIQTAAEKGTLNITPYGKFDTTEDLQRYMVNHDSYYEWRADEKKGEGYIATYPTIYWNGLHMASLPIVPGVTYDIYFDMKIPSGTDRWEVLHHCTDNYHTSTSYTLTKVSEINEVTDEWQRLHVRITDMKPISGEGRKLEGQFIDIKPRRFAGNNAWLFIDNLEVYPSGETDYDWENYMNFFERKQDPFDMDDGYDDEQPTGNYRFSDVPDEHWAKDSIKALAANSYIQGMGDGIYSPEGKVTRAEFFTMAYNTSMNLPFEEYKEVYSDVKEGHWFTSAIQTAYEIGVIDPAMAPEGKFYPDQPITREEAATVFAKLAEIRRAKAKADIPSFTDEGEISDWTREGVNKSVKYGLFSGYPDGSFKPKGLITRAEIAKVFFSLIELNGRLGVYVDGDEGDDSNDGTKNAPLKTIEAARDFVRPYLEDMTNHIFVFINEGTYNLTEKIVWGNEDSGSNGYNVIYTSSGKNQAEFTMAEHFDGFTLHDPDKNIWKTYVGNNPARQVYINGVRGVRARSNEYVNWDGFLTDLQINHTNGTGDMWHSKDGYYTCKNPEYANLTNQEDIEIICSTMWQAPILKVESISKIGETHIRIDIQDDSWDYIFNPEDSHATSIRPNVIENAYELLDAKGEWYINKKDGYLYYMPRDFENPETMVATIATGGQGFVIAGDSSKEKIHNIVFDNLSFKYNNWLYPNEHGYRDTLAGFLKSYPNSYIYKYEGDGRTWGEREDAFVTVVDANYVDVTNCKVSHMGGGGIYYQGVFQNCDVVGNYVYDISGCGIMMGNALFELYDIYKYWRTSRYENYLINNKVNNNLVHDTGVDYWGSPGIMTSTHVNLEAMYNEVYNTNYSNFINGWGLESTEDKTNVYSGNKIQYNYLHDAMLRTRDGGNTYFLGSTGGVNEYSHNYLENSREGMAAMYFDSGNDRWQVFNNVIDLSEEYHWEADPSYSGGTPNWMTIPKQKLYPLKLYNNYTTSNTPQAPMKDPNIWEEPIKYEPGERPAEAQKIVDEAGLQLEYWGEFPDTVQRLKLENKETELWYIDKGETLQMEVTKMGRKMQDLGKEGIMYFSTNDDIATIDENGLITCVGRGKCSVYAQYLDGEVIRSNWMNLVCDELVTEITSDLTKVVMLPGGTADIRATATTISGGEKKVYPQILGLDSSIATYDSQAGTLKGISDGNMFLTLIYEEDGVSLTKEIEVSVISHSKGDETLEFEKTSWKPEADDPFFDADNWTGATNQLEHGIIDVKGVRTTGAPAVYKERLTEENSIVSFDVKIKDPGMWPSFAFNLADANEEQNHSARDEYLVGFNNIGIELQKFVNGKQISIFGPPHLNPTSGGYFLNQSLVATSGVLYQWGQSYSVTIGSIQEENGVRLIFIMNGHPIFDYLDTDKYIEGPGYFGVFETAGSFEISPFTGRKFY